MRDADGISRTDIGDELGIKRTTVEYHQERLTEHGFSLACEHVGSNVWEWRVTDTPDGFDLGALTFERDESDTDTDTTAAATATDTTSEEPDTSPLPDLSDTPVGDADPTHDDLTDRERVVVDELETGATVADLTDRLDERESIVRQHLRDLRADGWRVYIDDTAGHIAIESDEPLRSSEHKGTRTRKANRWWELRHNQLVRQYRAVDAPDTTLAATDGREDWCLHMTDLHAGDVERNDEGEVVYATDMIPDVVDYITEQGLSLAAKHGSDYDTAHLLWGGDFVTNEGIYEGQFEDLDAWLDEQHETLIDPLIRQVKAFAESDHFETVQIVCQVGNHGQHRASGTSRQANADLILYKTIRNTIAHLQSHGGVLSNVRFVIGSAKPYRNFELRGGALRGHLRHGQHRRPQAETAARSNEWTKTLVDHDFDLALMGHYHVSGRIPWDGPPILVSPSPKPAGEFVERIGGRLDSAHQGVATTFGVSDDGLTGVFPVDSRKFERPTVDAAGGDA
jgi:DNA-binding CsgD family transcriptional regulator